MRDDTVKFPALLGHRDRWSRELRRLDATARHPGLFDGLPPAVPDACDVHGHAPGKRAALRALQMLAQAFELGDAACAEWYRLFAFGELPQPDGALLGLPRPRLDDLLLRACAVCCARDGGDLSRRYADAWAMARVIRPAIAAAQKLPAAHHNTLTVDGRHQQCTGLRLPRPADRPHSLRVLYWQMRAKLVIALCDPVLVEQQGSLINIAVVGRTNFRFDLASQSVEWPHVMRFHGNGFSELVHSWNDVTQPQAWVSAWFLAEWNRLAPERAAWTFKQSRHFKMLCVQLLPRDPAIADMARAVTQTVRHQPAVPRDALALVLRIARQAPNIGATPKATQSIWRYQALHGDLWRHAPQLHFLMPQVHRWVDEAAVPPALRHLGDLRRLLLARGLLPGSWRWLMASHNDPNRTALMRACPGVRLPLDDALTMINLVAASGRLETAEFLGTYFVRATLSKLWEVPAQRRAFCSLAWLMDIAASHTRALARTSRDFEWFAKHDLYPVLTWILEQNWQPDVNQRRAAWPAIERAYHRALQHHGPLDRHWPGIDQPVGMLGLYAHCITNVHVLVAEGLQMRRCIGDYAQDAVGRTFLAFSVRDEQDRRIAMFSFTRDTVGGSWQPDQCRGPANADCADPRVSKLMEWVHVLLITGVVP